MHCPYCNSEDLKVVDSRPMEEENTIRRRRECLSCQKRFNTNEIIQEITFMIVKKDGSRQLYDREKVLKGIARSCQKRPVSIDEMEEVVRELEKHMYSQGEKEVTSSQIGEFILQRLKNLDQVSYIRFASVYREFEDLSSFVEELKNLGLEEI